MGQVQRRRQQDIELWELYEEESGKGQRDGRRRNTGGDSGRNGRRTEGGQNALRREPGRDAPRTRQSRETAGGVGRTRQGRETAGSGGRVRQSRETAGGGGRVRQGRETAGSGGRVRQGRETAGSGGRTGEGGSIRLYEVRRSEARPGSKAADTVRRSGSAARTRRMNRNNDISGISVIGRDPKTGYRGSARPVQSIKRRRAKRRRELLHKTVIALLMVMCLVMIYFITGQIYQMVQKNREEKPLPAMKEQTFMADSSRTRIEPPEMIQDLLEINEYSRPGDKLSRINSIFVHYTANPGTSAAQNRSYFANLAETHERSASAHLIIGYEGELIQCIPFDEQAYAVMTRNEDSISIECCYLSDDGSFTQETYDTLVHTLAWLLDQYDLSTEDILRHYDCGGKLCPLYYAENEGAWDRLRQDVEAYLIQAGQATT